MLYKLMLVAAIAIAAAMAEAPLAGHRAPYPAAGFRPGKPFPLPNEYLPPVDFGASEQQQYDQGFTFEVTKQRVDFAGQEVQSFPINEPQTQYGPPPQSGSFNPQNTPDNRRPFFGQRPVPRRPNGGRPFQGRPGQQPSFVPAAQPNYPQTSLVNFPPQRLPNPATDERFEPQQSYPSNRPEQQHQPAVEYGAPLDPRNGPVDEDAQYQQDNIDELQKQFALDALNAAVENYNRLQDNNSDKITQGQYFVVSPEGNVQKVQFTTKQNEQEVNKNDFTAELKYTKVGELKDPLYKYNADGQLVRIVK